MKSKLAAILWPNSKEVGVKEAIAPMPIKVKAFQHQVQGYNMALRTMGVMEG
ncbi:hypothetical protein [Clostridium formicaceticum]|uniref:Uncharacterized protein n=1 Tax=Clostridium formicaceticum TaxID=1497 RepID=A0AAC9RPX3_9CLOT|nr:hypothetical protein [Clostridium formicaceticum]ARE89095.1 hypothetical protein CLFO_35010 [Clostridium formicaceticum]